MAVERKRQENFLILSRLLGRASKPTVMAWCVGLGYGNASLVAGSRALQPTDEEGLYTASWRGVRGSQKERFRCA